MLSPLAVVKWMIERAKGSPGLPPLTHMKIHKLLFYAQCWHLSVFGERLFQGSFEAWKAGPVCPAVFQALKGSAARPVERLPLPTNFAPVPDRERLFLESVWERYAPLTAEELSAATHREKPWAATWKAANVGPDNRCSDVIPESAMKEFCDAISVEATVHSPFLDPAAVWRGVVEIAQGKTVPGEVVLAKLEARGKR